MSFDYGYTCSAIDAEIAGAKETILDVIEDVARDICPPYASTKVGEEYLKGMAGSLYDYLEPIFEKTRETNEDMRKEADRQIEDLEDQIGELKAIIKEAEAFLG